MAAVDVWREQFPSGEGLRVGIPLGLGSVVLRLVLALPLTGTTLGLVSPCLCAFGVTAWDRMQGPASP